MSSWLFLASAIAAGIFAARLMGIGYAALMRRLVRVRRRIRAARLRREMKDLGGAAADFWELQNWLRAHKVSYRILAACLGCSHNTVARLVKGKFATVNPDIRQKLEEATKGAIGDREWAAFLFRKIKARPA